MDITPRPAAAVGGFTASGQSAPFTLAGTTPTSAFLASIITGVTGTNPSLTAYLDVSDGTNWIQVAALTAQTSAGTQYATGQVAAANPNLINLARIRWAVSGANAQFAGQIFATASG